MPRIRYHIVFLILIMHIFVCNNTKLQANVANIKTNGVTYAVIIGISDYFEVPDLEFAHKDAQAFANFLKSKAGGNVDSTNIKLFLNKDATAMNIGDAFLWINRVVMKGDKVYIYFAGHGDVEALNDVENGLLLLYRAPVSSYFAFGNDYLPVYELKKFLVTLTSKGVDGILITDACRSGKLAGGISGGQQTFKALGTNWSNEIKIMSCQPDELSQEGPQWGGGGGVFTYHLIKGLQGLADYNNDGHVSLHEIEQYLIQQVSKEAAPAKQTPFTIGNKDYTIVAVDEPTLMAVKKQQGSQYPLITAINIKGFEGSFFNKFDTSVLFNYSKFQKALFLKNLLQPEDNNAYYYYNLLSNLPNSSDIVRIMQRNLAAALQDEAMTIIFPLLKGENVKADISQLEYASKCLEIAIGLLGEDHYISKSLKARKLFLDASALLIYCDIVQDSSKYYRLIDLSIAQLLESIDLEPNAAYAYFGMAYACDKGKKFTKAIQLYKTYLLFVPNSAAAYNNIGQIYEQQKQYKLAIEYYQKAININPELTPSYSNIAKCYIAQKRYKKAIENYEIAIRLDLKKKSSDGSAARSEAQVYYDHAQGYFSKHQYLKAIGSYQKAVSLSLKNKVFLFASGL